MIASWYEHDVQMPQGTCSYGSIDSVLQDASPHWALHGILGADDVLHPAFIVRVPGAADTGALH